MRTTKTAAAVALIALLTACGSSTASAPSSAAPPASSSAASSTAETTPAETTAPKPVTCDDMAKVSTTLTTKIHYVALNVGTSNDSSTYYPAIEEAMAQLTQLATDCAPQAVEPVAALAAAVADLLDQTVPGADSAAIATDKALLAAVREAGIAAYSSLRLPTNGWENRPEDTVTG